MENRKLNIILIVVSIIVVIVIAYMIYLIQRNERSRVFFDYNDIVGTEWKNEDEYIEFSIIDNEIVFSIDDGIVINGTITDFNSETGEIIYKMNDTEEREKLYVRSVGDSYIVLWYDRAEYRLSN